MIIKSIEEKQIKGISIRTKNADEMNPETSKIATLWQQFDNNVRVDYKSGARVYGVYFDYESDASGEFSVLAGADQIESSELDLATVSLPSTKYMIFNGQGEMPQVVIDTWGQVWAHFSDGSSKEQRAYTTDFEHYKSENEVDIYIAIK